MTAKKSQTILIVEDEMPLRNAIRDKLLREGFQVLEAQNGQEGFDLASSKKPDFVLMDILMPRMHGFECLSMMRAEDWGKKTPVILLSNMSNEPKAIEITKKDKNCDYWVKSDVTMKKIVDRIKEKLDI